MLTGSLRKFGTSLGTFLSGKPVNLTLTANVACGGFPLPNDCKLTC
ncbi:MAG: hypothetical protein ACTS6P_01100 [Candidatus Hodgkinia cicadicola]